jgi:hypothetical protein
MNLPLRLTLHRSVILIIKTQSASKAANVLQTKEKPSRQAGGFVI